MDHNRIQLIGRLTKDPVFKEPGRRGDSHCTFILAVNRVVPNEKGPKADYLPCSLWGDEAKRFVETRAKGDEVGLIGRIRTEHVQQDNGDHKFFWEVRVDRVFYGRKSLKNMQLAPAGDNATRAVGQLSEEFADA